MGNPVSARKVRKVVEHQGNALEELAPIIRSLAATVQRLDGVSRRGFWGRLRWLVWGD
jgi:hypothetical protein